MIIHPTQHRGLSVREAARIQSFPDNFIFKGGIQSQQQQVANTVLCFGYNKNVILVDTNINRIFSRVLIKIALIKLLIIILYGMSWKNSQYLVIIKNFLWL